MVLRPNYQSISKEYTVGKNNCFQHYSWQQYHIRPLDSVGILPCNSLIVMVATAMSIFLNGLVPVELIKPPSSPEVILGRHIFNEVMYMTCNGLYNGQPPCSKQKEQTGNIMSSVLF